MHAPAITVVAFCPNRPSAHQVKQGPEQCGIVALGFRCGTLASDLRADATAGDITLCHSCHIPQKNYHGHSDGSILRRQHCSRVDNARSSGRASCSSQAHYPCARGRWCIRKPILRPVSCGHGCIASSIATADLRIWFEPRMQPIWSPWLLSLVLTLRLFVMVQQSRYVSAFSKSVLPNMMRSLWLG